MCRSCADRSRREASRHAPREALAENGTRRRRKSAEIRAKIKELLSAGGAPEARGHGLEEPIVPLLMNLLGLSRAQVFRHLAAVRGPPSAPMKVLTPLQRLAKTLEACRTKPPQGLPADALPLLGELHAVLAGVHDRTSDDTPSC